MTLNDAGQPPGQLGLPLPMARVESEMRRAVEQQQQRKPQEFGQIERHRGVQGNAWVVAGTRIPTAAIWSFHAAGYTVDQIIEQYPHLTRADVERAIAHESAERRLKAS